MSSTGDDGRSVDIAAAEEQPGARDGAGALHTPDRRALILGSTGVLAALLAACGFGGSDGDSPAAGASQSPAVPGGTLGLGIVGIIVTDLGAALTFYRSLGIDIPDGVDTSKGAYRHTMPNGTILYWETIAYVRAYFPGYERGTGDRRIVLEFGFASADDVDAMYARLTGDGAEEVSPLVSWGDIRHGIVTDPDGNQISLRYPPVS